MPKNLNKEEIEDIPVVDDVLVDTAAELVELPAVAPAVHGPVAGKRALGVKEPIIFKWKLIGTSHNMTLTLFKSVEREDVDAQYERTLREGYYTNLKILDADAKIDQPAQPKGMKKPGTRFQRGGKGAVSPNALERWGEGKPRTAKRTEVAKRSASPPRKPASAKSALKSVVKAKKKKTGQSVGASKRTVKKR